MQNIDYTTRPAGQPEGYDFYVPINEEMSRQLEKADYKVRMAVMNIATVIANSVDFSSAIYDRYYNRLLECEREYDKLKDEVSKSIVIPFMESYHGEKSNVSVQWSHSFKTPFVDIKYTYDIADHSVEKDLAVGSFRISEVGISDDIFNKLKELTVSTNAGKEIFNYIVNNYPNPDDRQQLKIDEFTAKRDDRMYEYEGLKQDVTNIVNSFIEECNIANSSVSLQWGIDFETRELTLTKTTL